jgi:hypothetical protein
MKWFYKSAGGRKVTVGLIVAAVVVVADLLGADLADRTIDHLQKIGQWVIVMIAAEDSVTKVASAIGKRKGGGK